MTETTCLIFIIDIDTISVTRADSSGGEGISKKKIVADTINKFYFK